MVVITWEYSFFENSQVIALIGRKYNIQNTIYYTEDIHSQPLSNSHSPYFLKEHFSLVVQQ